MVMHANRSLGTEPWFLPRGSIAGSIRHASVVREGMGLLVADINYDEDAEYEYVGGEYLKFHYKLNGGSSISGEHGECEVLRPGHMNFLVQPRGSLKRETVKKGTHDRSVTLVCNREFTAQFLAKSAANLPVAIDDYIRQRASSLSLAPLPLAPQFRTIVEEMLQPAPNDAMRDMLLDAKAMELLCLTVNQLFNVPADISLRARDLAKVRELCALFDEQPASNLSITELCKLMAWNETQMMDCFKRVTGTTISNYRHRVRMENARRQLRQSEASITEIAFDAGYEHPSNFATAFKRTFGISPKFARKDRH